VSALYLGVAKVTSGAIAAGYSYFNELSHPVFEKQTSSCSASCSKASASNSSYADQKPMTFAHSNVDKEIKDTSSSWCELSQNDVLTHTFQHVTLGVRSRIHEHVHLQCQISPITDLHTVSSKEQRIKAPVF
jgi:hypothetical protein